MKEKILAIIKSVLGPDAGAVELSVPEHDAFGHYSTNVALRLAKERKKKPLNLAGELATEFMNKAPAGFFEKVEPAPPGFINFWLSKKTIGDEFQNVSLSKDFGASAVGQKKTVIVEYSDPNIAKIMHVGHLRTTIIGDALAKILSFLDYKVIKWNYVGDWGTQFGKLIAAYKLWGNPADVERSPMQELQALYVRFHKEEKADPGLEKRGQEEFKKLEDGDAENRKLWQWFKDESLKEFGKIYKTLGVDFDVWVGESTFESKMKSVVKELRDKGIAEPSEGAIVVKLDAQGLPPALVEKSDGASVYLTRDIANLAYRLKEYKPAKILYVVANEQALYFEQLFAVVKRLGLDSAELIHVKYGLVLGASGKKLSTREGQAQPAQEVIDDAVVKVRSIIEAKHPDLSEDEKREIAYAVALGALKYNDLKENRMTDIIFDWDKMLDFSGDSAPYLQYTYARLASILRKAGITAKGEGDTASLLESDHGLELMRRIFEFPDIVARAGELYSTSVLATYLYRLAVAANKFYETTPILNDENTARLAARLMLVEVAARTLRSGLGLLGITTPEKI